MITETNHGSGPSWIKEAARRCREALEQWKVLEGPVDQRPCGVQNAINLCKRVEEEKDVGAKAHRFLGWAQCVANAHGLLTLHEILAHVREARAAAQARSPFEPTHRHAEGGLYRVISRDKVKMKIGAHWHEAVLYHDVEGNRYVRTKGEFEQRFTELKA